MNTLFCVVGRTCAGKHTFVKHLCNAFPEKFKQLVMPVQNIKQGINTTDGYYLCITTPDELEHITKNYPDIPIVTIYIYATDEVRQLRARLMMDYYPDEYFAKEQENKLQFDKFEFTTAYDILIDNSIDTQGKLTVHIPSEKTLIVPDILDIFSSISH